MRSLFLRGRLSFNCIYIEAAENTAENRISSAERYAKVYNIDYNRCIFADTVSRPAPRRNHSRTRLRIGVPETRQPFVMRKEDLLVPTPALPDVVLSDKDKAEVRIARIRRPNCSLPDYY